MLVLQRAFVNAVSGSLLRAPDFKNKTDPTRMGMVTMATTVSNYEPEFVLKVMHMGKDSIRYTANVTL